jgi:hypothetical protein
VDGLASFVGEFDHQQDRQLLCGRFDLVRNVRSWRCASPQTGESERDSQHTGGPTTRQEALAARRSAVSAGSGSEVGVGRVMTKNDGDRSLHRSPEVNLLLSRSTYFDTESPVF